MHPTTVSSPATRRHRSARFARLITALALVAAPEAPAAQELDFETLFAPGAHGRRPTSLAWAPNGERLAFFFEDDEGKGLWLFDATGARTSILRRESDGDLLDSLHWSPDGDSILVVTAGDLLLLAVADGGARRLTSTEVKEEDPKFSPDGSTIAFVREADLWLLDVATGEERRLTLDGRENATLNGKTDWVYWEEIWSRDSTGHWWSPSGERIAYYRFDESPVPVYPLLSYDGVYPSVVEQKYPKAGQSNPLVRVGVLDLATAATTWLETGDDGDVYLARVDWLPGGKQLAVQRLDRDQTHLDLLLCSPVDGNCSTLHSERSDTWVNLTKDLRFLEDGRFLWTSERSGLRRLELRATDGTLLRELTPDGWTVDHVDALVEDRSSVVWTGYRTDPLGARHRTVVRQSLTDGGLVELTDRHSWSSARVAATGGRLAVTTSGADKPPTTEALTSSGEPISALPSTPPTGYDPAALPQWQFLTIPGPQGIRLPAMMLAPPNLDPTKRYPAIMYHYGGPASQVVSDRWGTRGRNLWHKMMAERGYVILAVDNEASNFFGKTGADLLHRRFGPRNLAAQLAGVDFLAGLGYVDTERVGLWGWSGGGSNTLYAVLNSPGTWKAAVAGAPVTDWRLYDTIWTERYLDLPSDNPDGYEQSSAVSHADRLEDALLMVHGTADDNVHPQNTMVMSAKLIASGKAFEQAIHPGQKHGFKGRDSRQFYERMTEFFDRHLR